MFVEWPNYIRSLARDKLWSKAACRPAAPMPLTAPSFPWQSLRGPFINFNPGLIASGTSSWLIHLVFPGQGSVPCTTDLVPASCPAPLGSAFWAFPGSELGLWNHTDLGLNSNTSTLVTSVPRPFTSPLWPQFPHLKSGIATPTNGCEPQWHAQHSICT